LLKTDRGEFWWKPVAHGEISRLPCPYGMSTTHLEHLEQMARDSARELDKGLFHHEIISDAEQRVSCEKINSYSA
jgi:hypothetical protein